MHDSDQAALTGRIEGLRCRSGRFKRLIVSGIPHVE
jgi:hypothetical protein